MKTTKSYYLSIFHVHGQNCFTGVDTNIWSWIDLGKCHYFLYLWKRILLHLYYRLLLLQRYCSAKWLGVEWKNGFNLDKMLEWNISNQQVTEIKMRVTFFQWGSSSCWQQYHIVYQLVRIVQNCIFWYGKMCVFDCSVRAQQSEVFFAWNGKLNLLLILILLLSSRPESGISRFTHRLSLKERGAKAEKPSSDRPLSYRRRSLSVDW